MSYANENECEAAGLDIKKVGSLARRFEKLSKEAHAMGLYVFGGSGSGTLRYSDRDGGNTPLIVASISPNGFDGGCGASRNDGDGLLRGE